MASGRTAPPRLAVAVPPSPRTGAAAAPVNDPLDSANSVSSTRSQDFQIGQHASTFHSSFSPPEHSLLSHSPALSRRCRSNSGDCASSTTATTRASKTLSDASISIAKARSRSAQKANDAMVYLDGPQVYTCAQCRTHLTSHDEIISKSFHGRHGRAYLFDHCVNVTIGEAEDRLLITGLHSVCDIFCKRCKNMVGWTYARAYEPSQKYKEGKFIIEKINLHLEKSDYYDVAPPAGERTDRFRERSISWGSESAHSSWNDIVYEYRPSSPTASLSRRSLERQGSTGNSSKVSAGDPPILLRPESGSHPPSPLL